MADELLIQSRVFDLLAWLLPKSEHFPKAYRFSLTRRLMDSALDLQDALVEAQTERGQRRQQALRNADRHLGRLRIYLRLAHQWRWLSDGQYEHISRMLLEIGRLLGGWLRRESGGRKA
ncbi:MAG: diversity-generating retroelement protein Avd [Parahaliea sp.]